MLVGTLLDLTMADKYIMFNDDSFCEPTTYQNKEDIPDHIKNAYVMEIIIPRSTKWYDGGGKIMITYRTGNF